MNIGKVKVETPVKKGQFPEFYGSWRFSEEGEEEGVDNVQVSIRTGVPGGDESEQQFNRLNLSCHASKGEAQALQVTGEKPLSSIC